VILGQLCFETMRLESLTKIIQPLIVSGPQNPDVTGITADSRRVRPGYLFVALKGLHEDGNGYIDDAIKRGATVIVSEQHNWKRRDVSHVCVEDTRRVLGEISCAYYGEPSSQLQMIGVTGTNGKTTVSFMAKEILKADGREPGMVGTVRYEIGDRQIPAGRTTPEAPELQAMLSQMVEAGCRSAVMEVSSHALDQKRAWGVDFDVAVFTNLTQDHLDYHRTMEEYFAAKARLFRGLGQMEKRAAAIINIDDAWGMKLAFINGFQVQAITFGVHPTAQVRAENLEVSANGSTFAVRTPWGDAQASLRLPGRFNVSNALAAIGSCGALGIDPQLMVDVLADMRTVPGRLEEIENNRGLKVYVDYAHTPDALQNVLGMLREFAEGRIIVVFGCGGDRDKAKRSQMGAAAASLADYTVITNDNPRSEEPGDIAKEILGGFRGGSDCEVVLDRKDAIAKAISLAERGDVILIAGKGHEIYQEFANTVVTFDDREVVRELLG